MGIPIISDILKAISGPLDKIIPDADKKIEVKAAVYEAIFATGIAQADTNKIEAGHASMFVAGWRPFLGWTCGIAIMYAYIGHPLLSWVLAVVATMAGVEIPPLPIISSDTLFELVFAMLGLGGLRTYEKIKGRARDA